MSYKRWLFISIFLFSIGLALGMAIPVSITDLLAKDLAAIQDIPDILAPFPQWAIFVFIFAKNVSAILISFALSPFLCLMPAMALIINGGLLGWVSASVLRKKSLGFLIAGLLPHGVFELPALIMAEAAAFSFGTAVILALLKREERDRLLPNLRQNMRYLTVAIILLLPAALIETYITPRLLN